MCLNVKKLWDMTIMLETRRATVRGCDHKTDQWAFRTSVTPSHPIGPAFAPIYGLSQLTGPPGPAGAGRHSTSNVTITKLVSHRKLKEKPRDSARRTENVVNFRLCNDGYGQRLDLPQSNWLIDWLTNWLTRNRKHRRAAAKPAACAKPLML